MDGKDSRDMYGLMKAAEHAGELRRGYRPDPEEVVTGTPPTLYKIYVATPPVQGQGEQIALIMVMALYPKERKTLGKVPGWSFEPIVRGAAARNEYGYRSDTIRSLLEWLFLHGCSDGRRANG